MPKFQRSDQWLYVELTELQGPYKRLRMRLKTLLLTKKSYPHDKSKKHGEDVADQRLS